MTRSFDSLTGNTPLLISVPHDGRLLPDSVEARMTPVGKAMPDTDWHVAELYEFAKDLGASFVVADYSRYVVDLNRPPDDAALYAGQIATGICPTQSFAGEPLYRDGAGVGDDEQRARIQDYWEPYHAHIAATLDTLRREYGYALLWDAHSIPSRVPRLFDGELPVLNVGTNDGASCAPDVAAAVSGVAATSPFPSVLNGRFKGGYITRHYGDPAQRVDAVQLEIAQRAYMDEDTGDMDTSKASILQGTLALMLDAFMESAAKSSR